MGTVVLVVPMRKDILRSHNGLLGPNVIVLLDSLALRAKTCFALLTGKPKGRYGAQEHEPRWEGCGARGCCTQMPMSRGQRTQALHSQQPCAEEACAWPELPCPLHTIGFVSQLGIVVLPSTESGHRVMGAA